MRRLSLVIPRWPLDKDVRLADGDVYDLCLDDTVTTPLVIRRAAGLWRVDRARRLPCASGCCLDRCLIASAGSTNASNGVTGRTTTTWPVCIKPGSRRSGWRPSGSITAAG